MIEDNSRKLGFGALVAIVFGMMVGSGIYNIPQNMAVSSGLTGVLIAWGVTALCILSLVATFKTLGDRRPDLDAGIYQYAHEGFGKYLGFNMAWGYWLSTCIANIAYAAMLNDSFGAFFPELLKHGWATFVFGTVLIWLMCGLLLRGIRTARMVNFVMAALKVCAIGFIVVLMWIYASVSGLESALTTGGPESLWEQVSGTMMVTLFCFIGIEGAVMMSARAKNPRHVGKASVAGFSLAWLLYVLVAVLSFGIMSKAGLSGLDDPSVAYVLKRCAGDWAYYFVIVSVIVSLLGGWLAWNLVCSQCAMEAAQVGVFPHRFLRMNGNGMPSYASVASAVMMEMFLVVVILSDDLYLSAVNITGMMVLPPYLMSGLYLWKASYRPAELGNPGRVKLARFRAAGVACTLSCGWMIWAGGIDLLLQTTIFYLPGAVFYMMTCNNGRHIMSKQAFLSAFSRGERWQLGLIAAGAVVSGILLIWG